jgi:Domain of unknown function (DUF1844)
MARLVVFLEREYQPALLTGLCDGGGEGHRDNAIFGKCRSGLKGRLVDEKNSPPRPIKVVDRRKFTAAGDPRDDSGKSRQRVDKKNPADLGEKPSQTPAAHVADEQAPPPPTDIETSPLFLELIKMLAQQSELMLVGAEDLPAQPAQARRLIDYLAVIEEKSKGNLSAEEAKALSAVVFQLRSEFLQRA